MANNLCWADDARALAAVVGTKAAAADEGADADDALMAAERDDRRMGRSILVVVDRVSGVLICYNRRGVCEMVMAPQQSSNRILQSSCIFVRVFLMQMDAWGGICSDKKIFFE